MDLYYTPLSHFARKVRILLACYDVDCRLIDVGNVAQSDAESFKNNPLMQVPVLVDGRTWIVDSDHISKYIIKKIDSTDRYNFSSENIFDLNTRAILNGIMAEEVKILLAKRTHVPIENYVFFEKAARSIQNGLEWCEENANQFESDGFEYRDMHLVCAFEHLQHSKIIQLPYPKLHTIVSKLSQQKAFKETSPLMIQNTFMQNT